MWKHFFLTPEFLMNFWKKQFLSELKQSAVNDNDYKNSKYFYQT